MFSQSIHIFQALANAENERKLDEKIKTIEIRSVIASSDVTGLAFRPRSFAHSCSAFLAVRAL